MGAGNQPDRRGEGVSVRGNSWTTTVLTFSREYVKITKDYALAAAEAFQQIEQDEPRPFNFVYVSGAGTTHEPGPFTAIFARVKGQTEIALADMRKANPLFHASTSRPAFVDPAAHDAIKPYIPQLTLPLAVTSAVLGPVIRVAVKNTWSPTEPLGNFLTRMAMGRFDHAMDGPGIQKIGAFPVIENSAIRRLMGLDK